MPLNDRDTFTPYMLPASEKVAPALQPLVKEYGKLFNDRRAAQQSLSHLEDAHRRAVDADKVALAQALRGGKADPGNKNVEKLIQERENTRRTLEALDLAILDVEAELESVFEDTRDEHRPVVEAEIAEASEEYEAAINALGAARTKLTSTVALRHFLNNFPEKGYRPGGWPLYKLIAVHGDPYDFGKVDEALRHDIELVDAPPKEPAAVGYIVHEHTHEIDAPDWIPGELGNSVDRQIRAGHP